MRSEKEMMDLVLSLAEQDERIRPLRGHAQILIYLRTNSRIMMSHTS